MIEWLDALADDIAGYVLGSDGLCEVDRITVTAGRPNAPVGTDCKAIYVFADEITDSSQFEAGCQVRARLTVNYEIHVCYDEEGTDQTDDQHYTAAECLYGLIAAVWCGLVADKDAGILMGLGSCDAIELGPLEVNPRQGGNVSALGSVTIPYVC